MNFLSRKFILAVSIILLTFVGLLIKVLDSSQWVTVSTMIMGMYAAGNVGSAYVFNNKNESKG